MTTTQAIQKFNFKVRHGKFRYVSKTEKGEDGLPKVTVFGPGQIIDTEKFPITDATVKNLSDVLEAIPRVVEVQSPAKAA